MAENGKHLNIQIYGRVQGVGFRMSAEYKAYRLNLAGFIKNLPDGSVYIEIEGSERSVQKFLEWARKGPMFARVRKIDVEKGELEGYKRFKIRY